jgi:hypothetical protein
MILMIPLFRRIRSYRRIQNYLKFLLFQKNPQFRKYPKYLMIQRYLKYLQFLCFPRNRKYLMILLRLTKPIRYIYRSVVLMYRK